MCPAEILFRQESWVKHAWWKGNLAAVLLATGCGIETQQDLGTKSLALSADAGEACVQQLIAGVTVVTCEVVSDPPGGRVEADPPGVHVQGDPPGEHVQGDPPGVRVEADPPGARGAAEPPSPDKSLVADPPQPDKSVVADPPEPDKASGR